MASAEIVAVTTKSGEAIHAAWAGGFPAYTFCGVRAVRRMLVDVTVDGIQHPRRCEKCSARVVAKSAERGVA